MQAKLVAAMDRPDAPPDWQTPNDLSDMGLEWLRNGGAHDPIPRNQEPDTDIADRRPNVIAGELDALPEYIFDMYRRMLWRLEDDGQYRLEASRDPVGYLRRSISELQQASGQFIPLAIDRRARDQQWRLK